MRSSPPPDLLTLGAALLAAWLTICRALGIGPAALEQAGGAALPRIALAAVIATDKTRHRPGAN
jgi:hypothetical protein